MNYLDEHLTRYTFHVGTGYTRDNRHLTRKQVSSALAHARHHLAETYPGFTETHTFGGWRTDAGKLVMEPSIKFEVVTLASLETARSTAGFLRHVFHQSAVMLTHSHLQMEMV